MILTTAINYLKWMYEEHKGVKSVEKIYDDLAEKGLYDDLIEYSNRRKGFERALEELDFIPKKVLDIACGTGAMIEAANNKFHPHIIGIDISDQMLEYSRKRFKKNKNVELGKIDMFNLTYPQASFDLITIAFATRFIPKNKERDFVNLIDRLLKKNGMLIAMIMDSPYKNIVYSILSNLHFSGHSNLSMNNKQYFIKSLSKKFKFIKGLGVYRQYLVYNNYALFFKRI